MPGAGKSTVGVVLAKILNLDFVDADLVIQQQAGKTLQRLIDELGPLAFIEVEGDVLGGMDHDSTVISTGGSAVYSQEAIAHLAENGTVVYLRAGPDELRGRLGDFSERGIVMKREGGMGLADLYDERGPLYEQCAEVTIDIEGMDITQVANAVIDALGMRG